MHRNIISQLLGSACCSWFGSRQLVAFLPSDTVTYHFGQADCQTEVQYILGALAPIPSLNRWHTVALNNSWWSAGFGMHGLMGSAWEHMAAARNQQGHEAPIAQDGLKIPEGQPDADFHKEMTARLSSGSQFVQDADCRLEVMLASARD